MQLTFNDHTQHVICGAAFKIQVQPVRCIFKSPAEPGGAVAAVAAVADSQTQHSRRWRGRGNAPTHTLILTCFSDVEKQQAIPPSSSHSPLPFVRYEKALGQNESVYRIRYVSGIEQTTCCADDVKALGICKFLNTILVAINKANKQGKQTRGLENLASNRKQIKCMAYLHAINCHLHSMQARQRATPPNNNNDERPRPANV